MEENWGYPHDYGNPYQLHATHDHWWEISENWWKIDGIYRQPSSNHIKSMVSRKFPKHQSIERRNGPDIFFNWTTNQSWLGNMCGVNPEFIVSGGITGCSKMFQRCSKTRYTLEHMTPKMFTSNNFPASYLPEGAWGLTTSGIAERHGFPWGCLVVPSKPHFLRPTDVHSTVGTIESLQPYILLGFYGWRCSRLTWTANHWSH